MKWGMPTLVEYTSVKENVELGAKLGLQFIELNMNLPICTPETLSAAELTAYREETGMEFTIHLPEEMDLSSYHPSMRRGHLDRCKQAMEWACSAGIKTLNMHLNNGIYFTLPHAKVWIHAQYEARFLELLYDSYSELYEAAEAYGVELCIENTGQFQLPHIRSALSLLSGFDPFYLTWDVGHDAKAGFAEEAFFLQHQDRIRHMHLHDYNGKSDHQSLFTGIVPIRERLELARRQALSVVIEIKTSEALAESVSALKQEGF